MFKGINKHYFLLHFIVFIWGLTPLLGRFITADTWQLVWFRIILTVAVMFVWLKFTRQNMKIGKREFWQLSGIGIIIMFHWLAFYGAIKVSNISITMVSFSTGTLFSAIIEPIFFKRRVRLYEIVIGIIIITAIALIFSLETEYWLGIILGIIAALTSSLFGVFNGLMAKRLAPAVISFYELAAALVGLTVFILCLGNLNADFFQLDQRSVIGLLILSLLCTAFPFITSVNLTKYISPYTITLTLNLETVYGIIWAIVFYNESNDLKPGFYIGVFIILFSIFLNSWLKTYKEKKLQQNP